MKVNIGNYPKRGGKRKIDVLIDDYDTWSMDHTLSLIIAPLLKKFKDHKGGYPFVDDEDVPVELSRNEENEEVSSEELDKYRSDRWDYVLDEMIWTFDTISGNIEEPEFIKDGPEGQFFDNDMFKSHENRISNGCRLFGKYYRALWN
jgi:hypothetical protein